MTPSKLQHAIDATERGLRVFPQVGKVPKIRKWPENASSKATVVTRWWTRWPDADIGVALDADTYVLDADTPEANEAMANLDLPRTLMVGTARGCHAYFRVPHELARMPGGGIEGLRCIEGKGRPGPVTWAGSVHKSGHVYSVICDAPIATLPGALVREIGPRRAQVNAGEATDAERAEWAHRCRDARGHAASMMAGYDFCRELIQDGEAELRLILRTLRCDLDLMPTGWADRFFRAAATAGPLVASGSVGLDEAIGELTAVFYACDTDGGDPEHVLRSIERGVALGAREAGL